MRCYQTRSASVAAAFVVVGMHLCVRERGRDPVEDQSEGRKISRCQYWPLIGRARAHHRRRVAMIVSVVKTAGTLNLASAVYCYYSVASAVQ